MYVIFVCTVLHIPAPAADTACTLMLYSVPARRLFKMVEVKIGEPCVVTLSHTVVPLILYCTLYWKTARSVWGISQLTSRAGAVFTLLVRVMLLILEGAESGIQSYMTHPCWLCNFIQKCNEYRYVKVAQKNLYSSIQLYGQWKRIMHCNNFNNECISFAYIHCFMWLNGLLYMYTCVC